MTSRRYLKPGVARCGVRATLALAILRAMHVLVPSWWVVGLPALAAICGYGLAWSENWAVERKIERAHRELLAAARRGGPSQ